MIVRGVRALLVVDAAEDVVGILTSRDLMGARALEATVARGVEFGALKVADVMTPACAIEVLQIEDVLHAHVGDVVETLKHSGRQHALVVETDALHARCVIRGVFSASQIARQLGIATRSDDLQRTFAQIDRSMRR
jgi:CBS domain-containing protein